MKTGPSSLNPYAAPYVPFLKRMIADVKKDSSSGLESESGNEMVWYGGYQPDNLSTHSQQQHVTHSYTHTAGASQTVELSKRKDLHAGESFASSSHYPSETEKSNFDQEFMDLAYLQMKFPGISEESLSDVYFANRCDLDAAVDMLDQLELYPDDSSDKLPDTLDIGDGPESASESQEPNNLKSEAGASTSGSSDLPSAG